MENWFTPQSNSGTKAKEELAAATNAVQVKFSRCMLY